MQNNIDKFYKVPIALHKEVVSGTLKRHHEFLYVHLYSYANYKSCITDIIPGSQLCKELDIERNHLNHLLKELEDAGYIKRMYPNGKKRSKDVKVRLLDGKSELCQ